MFAKLATERLEGTCPRGYEPTPLKDTDEVCYCQMKTALYKTAKLRQTKRKCKIEMR